LAKNGEIDALPAVSKTTEREFIPIAETTKLIIPMGEK